MLGVFFFLTFWNYDTFLSVLFMYFEIGVFKWCGRIGVGGDISLFTFPHFYTMIVYFSGSGHTKRYTQTNRGTDHLFLSLFLQQYDGTKNATERVVSLMSAPGGAVRNCATLEHDLKYLKSGWKNSE